jgi:hypothetical protein
VALGETKPDSAIEQVLVGKGRLSSSVRKGALISVEAESTQASQAVYEPIETIDRRLQMYAYNAFAVKRYGHRSRSPVRHAPACPPRWKA